MNPQAFSRIERLNYAITALLAAFSWLVCSRDVALGLSVGSLLTSLNMTAIRSLIQRLFEGSSRTKMSAALLMLPKMLAVLAAAWASLRYLPINAMAFAAGFSMFFVSIAVETVRFVLNGGGSDNSGNRDSGAAL